MAVATEVKLRSGKFKFPVLQVEHGGRYYYKFAYNAGLMAEIKAMEGARYHGFEGGYPPKEVRDHTKEVKVWSIPITQRNLFQLEYLQGGNPYGKFDAKYVEADIQPRQTITGEVLAPYEHQIELIRFMLTRHYCIAAAEMGTGKTLAAIYTMELSGVTVDEGIWYVAPRSVLKAIERELRFWKSKIWPKLMTYDQLVKEHKLWELEGRPKAPRMVFLDESSRVKTPTAQRSQAAQNLADYVREDWGDEGYIVLMSGSPAPKAPVDWWKQCEIACPGFIREGTWEKFRNRLGLVVERENTITGGIFPQLVTWNDCVDKCAKCGKTKEEHEIAGATDVEAVANAHVFVPSKNEVAQLYERMKGLVLVKFKKDCLKDLPEKIYRIIRLKPKADTLRAAKLVQAVGRTVAEKLTMLRELSDGFQYKETQDGEIVCDVCNGSCSIREWVDRDDPDGETISEFGTLPEGIEEGRYELLDVTCKNCKGGKIPKIIRETVQIPTPKEDALRELLDEHEDVGRIVIYAGFTGSVDRVVSICQSEKWAVIRVDGRGWEVLDQNGARITKDALSVFQDLLEEYPRVAFIGQPGAAGMGLTLTKSPTIVYWSNDFNAESRIQSEDRIHRPGMDVNKGATIIDLIHLPSDEMVLENLRKKRKLQQMTLDGIDWSEKHDDERLF